MFCSTRQGRVWQDLELLQPGKKDNIDWVWIDTCCIDKTFSTELSEAINSMYTWYENSHVCYVFLEDVPEHSPLFSRTPFKYARWFSRGWCLQELIAPRKIEFYSADWTEIGTQNSLRVLIEDITGVPVAILQKEASLADLTIAQKFSWAYRRRTTREEDEAYCLLGIFGISMPLLYGEGRQAFHRLRLEIMKNTEDYSLFLWTDQYESHGGSTGVLASSPAWFPKRGFEAKQRIMDDRPKESLKGFKYKNIESIFLDSRALRRLPFDLTRWSPLQMTTRRLYLYSLTKEVQPASPAQDASSANLRLPLEPKVLVFWTGCVYSQQYLCIVLDQDVKSGFLKFVRKPALNIVLVPPSQLESLQLTAIYLNTDWQRGNRIKIQRPFSLHQAFQHFEVLVTKKCPEEIVLVKTFPPLALCLAVNDARGERVYSGKIDLYARFWLDFWIFDGNSGVTTGKFRIKLELNGLWPAGTVCDLATDIEQRVFPSGAGHRTENLTDSDLLIIKRRHVSDKNPVSLDDPGGTLKIFGNNSSVYNETELGQLAPIEDGDRPTGKLKMGCWYR
ncbi:hypothetical protein GLAREA_07219 [Glarea lozoyensis ATCC 20868]|uniref:Heterokaryon incompatibility domain-containing protein n=1 Tax=Glarea lozoyensis (strain ATCC 20868 / MF5171) TaxID=1116229 RepID=S3DQ76_GLAL2|nr:uncharacterized protein GLAREA_07219 [Glarea lozoyensis ATCC 20868]EPE34206.1 hypothetical protein GLAREA_07219 [Glarea lozoyensis ATCC 20868]